MIISSIKRKLIFFFQVKKVWQYPKHARVLIYDRSGSELFLTYLKKEQIEILDLSGEINMLILLKCLLLRKKKTYQEYYIDMVNPKVAITFIDNNPIFYLLKIGRPFLITIFVQNGIRSVIGDIFSHLIDNKDKSQTKYHVDYMLCFGRAVGNKYAEYIAGNIINVGSFKNNMIKKSVLLEKESSILFLSQFRKKSLASEAFLDNQGEKVLWEQFYLPEFFFLPLLKEYCIQNGFKLHVCGCLSNAQIEERFFYEELLGTEGWKFIPSGENKISYNLVDEAFCIFMIDSTLGYEALARGKKLAAFPARGKVISSKALNFGWPAELKEEGPFWTNILSTEEFKRIMDYIVNVNDEEWEEVRIKYIKDLIEYDPGNTKFLRLMKEIEICLN